MLRMKGLRLARGEALAAGLVKISPWGPFTWLGALLGVQGDVRGWAGGLAPPQLPPARNQRLRAEPREGSALVGCPGVGHQRIARDPRRAAGGCRHPLDRRVIVPWHQQALRRLTHRMLTHLVLTQRT